MHSILPTLLVLLAGTVLSAEPKLYVANALTNEGLFTDGIEGPACDEQGNIFCVKFGGEHTLGKTTPDGCAELFLDLPAGSKANGIRFGPDGLMYVADYTGHNILRINPETKETEVFAHEAEMSQPNDLAITIEGHLYASDPNWGEGTGRVWRIDRQGKVTCVVEGMGTTNGIDVSPDGETLYVNESDQRKVWAFTIGSEGELMDKRLIKEFPAQGMDGMRVDVKGNLYITRHGKGTVVKLSPQGEVMQEIKLPGSKPSNLCFGGKDGRTVYVTEMEHGQIVQFRVDQPGLEWKRMQERVALNKERKPLRFYRQAAVQEVCAWPNLTLSRDGSILAVLHNQPGHGTMEGDIECWASTNGLRWEKRSTITQHAPNTIRMNHAAGLAGNGDLVVLCSGWTNEKQAERPKQAEFRDAILGNWVLRSKDGGLSWDKQESFPKAEAGWTEYIPFGDICQGADGALHVSCYQGEYLDAAISSKTKGYRSWHFRSDDDGWTWKAVSLIGPRHNETTLFHLGGKSWLAAARVDAMDMFRSDDDGLTWTSLPRATERNEINGHLMRMKDGQLMLTYGVRIPGRYGVCAKFSDDEGRTWSGAVRIAHSYVWDCGYPSSVQLANGQIVTAYYSKDTPEYSGYQMGVAVWEATTRLTAENNK
ncbi:sugar lactone lactonase YvrE [Prosthecobacter fusiformis]|uniref:Sugar lactone lactonase YvrE n=1 Tax=Prosthecobacter fusiformis TaxID=48464 RepID=A0A4R7S0W7_9BACT|nr:SMP-30/gluconolactonase/LRE family protein [Prosthecobacter fusiformis]TDU70597.1 sugar lactone lactonase YvrE [Prosthecobacter fusiformis]